MEGCFWRGFHPVFFLVWPIQRPQRPKSCPSTWAFRPVTFPSQSSAESQPVGLPFKVPLFAPPPPTSPAPTPQTRPPAAPPVIGLAVLPGLFHSVCFFKSWFLFFCFVFLSVMWCFILFFLCVQWWGRQSTEPQTAAQAFLDDPHPSVWAGHIRVRGIRRGNMRMVRGQWGSNGGCLNCEGRLSENGHLLRPGCSLSSFRTV